MPQILAVVTYAGVFGNVFLVAFLAAMPPDHPLPWWALATFAGLNALVHALPSDGLPMPPKVSATVVLFLALLLTSLSACSSTQLAQVQTDITAGVAAACTDVASAAKINPTSPIVVYGEAACPLGVAAASLVQNSATIQWLGGIAAQIQADKAAAPAPAPAAAPATPS